jgi:hypothetical protein
VRRSCAGVRKMRRTPSAPQSGNRQNGVVYMSSPADHHGSRHAAYRPVRITDNCLARQFLPD